MKKVIYNFVENIDRLIQQLSMWREDLNFLIDGGNIIYAVDFSEVHAFLIPTQEHLESLKIGLFIGDEISSAKQHRLGLIHLFNTFTETVYLLPPHIREMWSYIRYWREKAEINQEKLNCVLPKAEKTLNSLTPKYKELLRGVISKDNTKIDIKESDIEELVKLIKDGEFGKIISEVSEFFISNIAYDNLSGLVNLVEKNKLSYQIGQQIFDPLKISITDHSFTFNDEEIDRIFNFFPQQSRDLKPINRRLDVRALLFLIRANKLLFEKNQKLILLTRDQGMLNVAKILPELSEKGEYSSDKNSFIRTLDLAFFDLIFYSIKDIKTKLNESESVEELLSSFKNAARVLLEHHTESTTWLSDAKHLLDRAKNLWDSYINLRLSQTLPEVSWLRDALEKEPAMIRKSSYKPINTNDVQLLKVLWELVLNPRYQKLAEQNINDLLKRLYDEALRFIFISILSGNSLKKIIDTFGEPDKNNQRTILRSRFPSPEYMSLHFTSFQGLLSELYSEHEPYEQFKRAQNAFFKVVQLLMERQSEAETEAEGFLFMAFVLGLLNLWDQADELARRSVELAQKNKLRNIEVEANYFLAIVNRKLADFSDNDPLIKVKDSFCFIRKAMINKLNNGLEDPRFLKEWSTIVIYYHYLSEKYGRPIKKRTINDIEKIFEPSEASPECAINALKKALKLVTDNDQEFPLRLVILNNLAFTAILSDIISLDEASQYIKQIDNELKRIDNSSHLVLSEPWLALEDTKIMVNAKRAYHEKNIPLLKKYIIELKQLQQQEDLTIREKKIIQRNLASVEKWYKEILHDYNRFHHSDDDADSTVGN